MNILEEWNPLGDDARNIKDLDNYRTEAIDILFNLELLGSKANSAKIVRDVINQAFNLYLSTEVCKDVGQKITKIINKSS